MNRTQKFLYNSITTASLQIVTLLAGLVISRVMLTIFGSEINGLISSISQFITYFALVELGLASATSFALYMPLASGDVCQINGIVSAAKNLYFQAGYIFLSLVLGLVFIYPIFVRVESLNPAEVGILVFVLGLKGVLEFFTLSKYRSLLAADQKTYIISITSIIHIIISAIIIVVMANLGANIILIRTISLFSVCLRSFILMIYVKIKYKYINYKAKPNTLALDKRWDAIYIQILNTVLSATPVIAVTIVLKDMRLVSVYVIFKMVSSGVSGILSIFKSGLSATFGDIIAKNEMSNLQKTYKCFEYMYFILLTIVSTVMLTTIMPFIQIYTSGINDINYNKPLLGILFTISCLLENIMTPQRMLINSSGKYKEMRFQVTAEVLIAIIGTFWLGSRFGLPGIVTAIILAHLFRATFLMNYIPKNVTHTKPIETFARELRVYGTVALLYFCISLFSFSVNDYMEWCAYAFVVGICVSVITILIWAIFEWEEFLNVINRTKNLLFKKGV